ncbi:GspE/PulE family protein [Thioalkalivibrio sp. ALE16]|uniref:GspE/PulE family protein n=1 Tax=Thioalkalivibrio sp. ALE16 TaxID=1158172 RepID=UPI00036F0CD5|nr:ATPase, T2SS/T4P/T4SS family [Thioalkalivibrio sp. ALE16]
MDNLTPVRPIGELLIERQLLTSGALDAALHEQRLTGERLGAILVRNGFVTRKQLIATLADTANPEVLSEPVETDRVTPDLLHRLRVMILGETSRRVLLASPSPRWYVENQLRPYFEGRVFEWMDYDPAIFEHHMDRLASYSAETELDRVLREAVMASVSDVHLVPKPAAYSLMHRYLGVRRILRDLDHEDGKRLVAQAKDRARVDMAETALPQDGAFRMALLERSVDFRVATLPESDGERLVIRVLDPEAAQPDLEALGLRHIDPWMKAATQPHGICLVCGATGSGKSTTLNATIRKLDRFGQSIQTVEDPVEHRLSFVGQVETNSGRGLDFPRALRGFMRSDPDVIVVGEIRDYETAKLAVQAAETGHMVFGTIHSDSPVGGIARIRDLGVPLEDFSGLLRSMLAQKLVRTLCPACEGQGCAACRQEGYAGRTLIAEVATFSGDESVQRALGGERWWSSMEEDAQSLVNDGVTTNEEIAQKLGSL